MEELTNIIILIFFGFCLSIMSDVHTAGVICLLLALILSLYHILYQEHGITRYVYIVLCFLYTPFLYYLPCIFYLEIKQKALKLIYIFYVLVYLISSPTQTIMLLYIALLWVAYLLRIRQLEHDKLNLKYMSQRDSTKELALLLEEKNNNLLISQEQEIKIATLHERNRIAREIHDHVGHLLSSSLLQIGAIQAMNQQENLKQSLQDVRATISKGMDNVRKSVHDLHNDAIDLQTAIQLLCKDFTFCETVFEYDVTHPLSNQAYYHLIAIIKEAMNNTMKHSDATKFQILIREQPGFYQCILHDNGTWKAIRQTGIGIQNIEDRVESMHGYCNIQYTNGFQIFMTIPKEAAPCAY